MKGGLMEKCFRIQYRDIKVNPDKYKVEHKWISPQGSTGIKYICYLGSTGYADASRSYIRSLVEVGYYVYVEGIKYMGDKSTLSAEDHVLSVCLHNSNLQYNTVIIHSPPPTWKRIIDRERQNNAHVRIYGLTVWETDRVYPEWLRTISHLSLSGLIVPSDWNRQIFEQSFMKLGKSSIKCPPIISIPHAICDVNLEESSDLNREFLYGKSKVVFLCIGTWSPRKGIDETIRCYLDAFNDKCDVVLYVKTGLTDYSELETLELNSKLETLKSSYVNPARIILDSSSRSDEYMNKLISNCDVYISLCNSEGVGLGACSAGLHNKTIVMTGYGGQREYLVNAHWISYRMGVVKVPKDFADWIRPPQEWAYPDSQDAIKIVRTVYEKFINKSESLDNSDLCIETATIDGTCTDVDLDSPSIAQDNRSYILSNFSYIAIGNKFRSLLGDVDNLSKLKSKSKSKTVSESKLNVNRHSKDVICPHCHGYRWG